MKRAEDLIIGCEHDGSYIPVNEVLRLIKLAQLEAIEETVNLCAKNAATVHDEKLLDEISPGLTSNDLIYKPSILNCAEILKKEIE